MASERSDDSSSSRPLLHDFNIDDSQQKGDPSISLNSLEDGGQICSELGLLRKQSRPGFWRRLRMSVRQRRNGAANGDFKGTSLNGREHRRPEIWGKGKRVCAMVSVLSVLVFVIVYVLNFFLGFLSVTASSQSWVLPSNLLDITASVTPIACHSHNDYWRRVPLYDALRWGCTGVEADVWLFSDDLFVGHSTNALTANRTFRSMYVDPLVKLLDHQNNATSASAVKNGIFPKEPSRTLVLLVDFKNDGRDIYPLVSKHLDALRGKGYLTHYNGSTTIPGPITVVGTGNAPFDLINSNTTYRDIFFDAPLDHLVPGSSANHGGQGTVGTTPDSHFDASNSYYASVDFRKAIGFVWWGRLNSKQLGLVRSQIESAHERGLKARYWSVPKWPVGVRNRVWKILVEEGMDYLNGDDLAGMVELDWSRRKVEGR